MKYFKSFMQFLTEGETKVVKVAGKEHESPSDKKLEKEVRINIGRFAPRRCSTEVPGVMFLDGITFPRRSRGGHRKPPFRSRRAGHAGAERRAG